MFDLCRTPSPYPGKDSDCAASARPNCLERNSKFPAAASLVRKRAHVHSAPRQPCISPASVPVVREGQRRSRETFHENTEGDESNKSSRLLPSLITGGRATPVARDPYSWNPAQRTERSHS